MDFSPRRRRSRRPLKDATNENNESVSVHSQKLRTSDASDSGRKRSKKTPKTMDFPPEVKSRKRSRCPLKDATNENNENVPVHSQKLRNSDASDSGRKRSKKTLTPPTGQRFISDFFTKSFKIEPSLSKENSQPTWTTIEVYREETPSTSSTSNASTENDDEIICIGENLSQRPVKIHSQPTFPITAVDKNEDYYAFLSEDEDTLIESLPPQYISDIESVIKSLLTCYVDIDPTLADLKFKKACVKINKVDVKDLEVNYPVEFDVIEHVKSDDGAIPDDLSDVLSDFPEEEEENLGDCFAEVDKILNISVKNGQREFLLKWNGYPYSKSSWEKAEHLVDADVLSAEFEKRELIRKKIVKNHLLLDDYKSIQQHWKHVNKDFLDIESDAFLEGLARSYNSYFRIHEWEDEMNKTLEANSQAKIYIENWIDVSHKPKDFEYIITNKITPEVQQILDESQRIYQETRKGNGVPNYGCTCTEIECGSKKMCCPDRFDVHFKYTSKGKLRRDFDEREQIVECWEHCACSSSCPTRLVQRGRQIPVMLFRTASRGWGVRACQKIEERSFVMEYVGEAITIEEASKRDPTYSFDMDGCGSHMSAFSIDATRFGNEARFINHSCDPNLIVISVYVEHLDQRFHRLALFALRDIQEGEELTFDYFKNVSKEEFKEKAKRVRSKTSVKRCHCGARNCRKVLA